MIKYPCLALLGVAVFYMIHKAHSPVAFLVFAAPTMIVACHLYMLLTSPREDERRYDD